MLLFNPEGALPSRIMAGIYSKEQGKGCSPDAHPSSMKKLPDQPADLPCTMLRNLMRPRRNLLPIPRSLKIFFTKTV